MYFHSPVEKHRTIRTWMNMKYQVYFFSFFLSISYVNAMDGKIHCSLLRNLLNKRILHWWYEEYWKGLFACLVYFKFVCLFVFGYHIVFFYMFVIAFIFVETSWRGPSNRCKSLFGNQIKSSQGDNDSSGYIVLKEYSTRMTTRQGKHQKWHVVCFDIFSNAVLK